MVSVSWAQEASTNQSGAVEIWLRLYQFSAAEFDSRALVETVDQLPPSLSLEDWLTMGKSMPSLESSLRNFSESNRAEIMNRFSFQLDRKCIMFDRAIFALGWLHSSEDTGKFLVGIQKDKIVGGRFFQSSIIQSLGMIADLDSVNCLGGNN